MIEDDGESIGLDRVLEALANPHRRAMVYLLGLQPCAINQLAQMRELSLPAIHKHIKILESADLVKRRKLGRTTFLTLNPEPLTQVQKWAGQFHTHWVSDQATFENYHHYLGKSAAAPQATAPPSPREKK